MSEDNKITLSGNLRINAVSPSMSALMLNVRKLEGERTELQKENAQLKRANNDRYHENLRLRSWLAQHDQSADYARGYADGMAEREAAAANEPLVDSAIGASLEAEFWSCGPADAPPPSKVEIDRAVDRIVRGKTTINFERHAALHNAILKGGRNAV